MDVQKPSIGRIVHYVDGERHLAAIVVRVWTDTCVNLQVFGDGSQDASAVRTVTSVVFSERPNDYSWHWPERV